MLFWCNEFMWEAALVTGAAATFEATNAAGRARPVVPLRYATWVSTMAYMYCAEALSLRMSDADTLRGALATVVSSAFNAHNAAPVRCARNCNHNDPKNQPYTHLTTLNQQCRAATCSSCSRPSRPRGPFSPPPPSSSFSLARRSSRAASAWRLRPRRASRRPQSSSSARSRSRAASVFRSSSLPRRSAGATARARASPSRTRRSTGASPSAARSSS